MSKKKSSAPAAAAPQQTMVEDPLQQMMMQNQMNEAMRRSTMLGDMTKQGMGAGYGEAPNTGGPDIFGGLLDKLGMAAGQRIDDRMQKYQGLLGGK